jgi:hypothetical protein
MVEAGESEYLELLKTRNLLIFFETPKAWKTAKSRLTGTYLERGVSVLLIDSDSGESISKRDIHSCCCARVPVEMCKFEFADRLHWRRQASRGHEYVLSSPVKFF